MAVLFDQDSSTRREVLAGNRGHCTDYERTSDFGRAREPFTWLSDDGPDEDNQLLVLELQEFKRTRSPVPFEAWEAQDEGWRVVLSGNVRVIYAEADARLPRVRALLQWAPSGSEGAPHTSSS